MQSSYDVHSLCECDILFHNNSPNLRTETVMQTGVTIKYHFFSFQLEFRAIAALFRREKYSGQLHYGIT